MQQPVPCFQNISQDVLQSCSKVFKSSPWAFTQYILYKTVLSGFCFLPLIISLPYLSALSIFLHLEDVQHMLFPLSGTLHLDLFRVVHSLNIPGQMFHFKEPFLDHSPPLSHSVIISLFLSQLRMSCSRVFIYHASPSRKQDLCQQGVWFIMAYWSFTYPCLMSVQTRRYEKQQRIQGLSWPMVGIPQDGCSDGGGRWNLRLQRKTGHTGTCYFLAI